MQVKAIKTPVVNVDDDLLVFLKKHLPPIHEKDIVVITSKIVGLCEGAVIPVSKNPTREEKHQIVRQEAEVYTDPHSSKYDLMLTVKHQILAVNAGIDESNADGVYVLWPKEPQNTVNAIWEWIRSEYSVKNVGVILSDSKTFPLKWGVIGTSLTHCGFKALHDMRGTPDLFGKALKMTQINVAEALAIAAVYEMGEGNESTPLAIIKDAKDVEFQDQVPSKEEIDFLTITPEDDAYAPILQTADWKKGGSGR